jgi:hypothetical protein
MRTSIRYSTSKGTLLIGDELASCYQGALNSKALRHGQGSYRYPNQHFRYEGEYVDGVKQGMQLSGQWDRMAPKMLQH